MIKVRLVNSKLDLENCVGNYGWKWTTKYGYSIKLVNQGRRADNGFKNGFLGKLEKWMGERIPGCKIKGDPHIKSRQETLKT